MTKEPEYDQQPMVPVLSSHEVKKGKVVGARRFGENLFFSEIRKVSSDASRVFAHTGVRRLSRVA